MSNILYINHYAGSPDMGMEFRPYYLSREWVKMGHKVVIIAGSFSHLRKRNPIINIDFQSELIDGIEYLWVFTGDYSGNGLERAITMGRFVWKLWLHAKKIAKRYKPDIVIASSTYPFDTYPAQRIARLSGGKYIHEVHDMWPATLYEVGGMSKYHPFVVLMQIAEDSAYKHCDKCVSLLPYSKEYMLNHGLHPSKFINIQNGVVEEEWDNPPPLPEEHQVFFDSHKNYFIIGYCGGHSVSNALDNILDVAKQELNTKIIFVFVGDGIEKEKLVRKKITEEINNAFFLPSVPKKCIPSLFKYFDCSIMTAKSSPLYKYGLCMNKMYDSMMAGKPIICAINAPRSLVQIYSCGYQVNSDDITGINKAIEKIYMMSNEERTKMGMNGKKAVLEHFTYKQLAETFVEKAFREI